MISKMSEKYGAAPGTVLYVGARDQTEPKIRVMEITPEKVIDAQPGIEQVSLQERQSHPVWLSVAGLNAADQLEKLGEAAGIHKLILEDILNTDQQPKLDEDGDALAVFLKAPMHDDDGGLVFEHICIYHDNNRVITFQDRPDDLFGPVRKRIHGNPPRFNELGSDYLMYALCDIVIDSYYVVINLCGDQLDDLEEAIVVGRDDKLLKDIQRLRKQVSRLRKAVWPVDEIAGKLLSPGQQAIQETTRAYLRDLKDHTSHVIDMLEHYRERLAQLMDSHNANLNQRLNDVMKILTVVATLFIPVTFLAGVYGMNFHHIPELAWAYSYPVFWLVTVLIIAGLLVLFKRKSII